MNYMDYYNACDTRANKGLDVLTEYLKSKKELRWIEIVSEKITTIDVELVVIEPFLHKDGILTEFIGTWEFNNKGFLIE